MELILIRHGLPVRRDDTSDPPLAEEGLEQARRVGAYLADERIDKVFSSPMHRAVQTARPFAEARRHEIHLREGIVEFDRGSGAYIPMEQLKRDDYEAWKAFAQGGYGMDISEFQKTVVETREEIVTTHAGRNVAVFCHSGVINVWSAHVLGMAPRLFFEPAYASVHRYLCARSGERNIVGLNDVSHLRSPPT